MANNNWLNISIQCYLFFNFLCASSTKKSRNSIKKITVLLGSFIDFRCLRCVQSASTIRMKRLFLPGVLFRMKDRLESFVVFVNFCKKSHPGWRGNFVNKTISSFGSLLQYYVSGLNCLSKLKALCLIRGPIMIFPCRRTENRT